MMNNVADKKLESFELTGKHVLLAFCGFFAVIIVVNLTMAFLAKGSWTGLVVKNSYVASQKFNSRLEQAKAQTANGIRSNLTYENGVLYVSVLDQKGQMLPLDALQLFVGRPAFEGLDQRIVLDDNKSGEQHLKLDLATGVWNISLQGEVRNTPYQRDARLYVTKSGTGVVE